MAGCVLIKSDRPRIPGSLGDIAGGEKKQIAKEGQGSWEPPAQRAKAHDSQVKGSTEWTEWEVHRNEEHNGCYDVDLGPSLYFPCRLISRGKFKISHEPFSSQPGTEGQ